PFRMPRAVYWSLALACVSAGLLALRYRFEGRIDLRLPATPAIAQFLQDARTEIAAMRRFFERPAHAEAQPQLEQAREDSPDGKRKSSTAGAQSSGDAQKDRDNQMAGDDTGESAAERRQDQDSSGQNGGPSQGSSRTASSRSGNSDQ